MGTGRFGGGGSGALGRAGSSSGISRSGSAHTSSDGKSGGGFFAWKAGIGGKPDPLLARELVRATLAQRNVATYIHTLAGSDAVKGCYDELGRLSALLAKEEGWVPVAKSYGVKDAPGCLAELEGIIESKHSASVIEAHREVARAAVLDVLIAAVRGDDDVFLDGDAKAVLSRLDYAVFASLSGHYFGSILQRALLRELPPLSEREAPVVREAIQERADFLIAKFESQMKKDGVTHRDLFRVISGNQEWFESRLRQVIE